MNKTYQELCDELQQVRAERDALAAQVKGPDGFETWKDAAVDERLRRVSAEKREQALAAHVERLREELIAVRGDYQCDCGYPSCSRESQLRGINAVLSETPETSLARLKAQWQAEVLYGLKLRMEELTVERNEYRNLSDKHSDLWRSERGRADALAAHVEMLESIINSSDLTDRPHVMSALNSLPETSLAHRIAHVAEQCGLPRLLRDYRAMVGLASITGPAKRERIEHVTSVEIAMFGAKQKYVISATRGRQAGGDA